MHNTMPLTLRIDPWTPSYESAVQVEEDDAAVPTDVDPYVETEAWEPLTPRESARPPAVVFVDGVQRVETRVIGEDDGRMVYGAFASIAVGATFARPGAAECAVELPQRILGLTGGASFPPVEVPCGRLTLRFEAHSTDIAGVNAVHEAVQSARRAAETKLGEQLVDAGHPLVIVDGRLNLQPSRHSMTLGLVKTMHKQYLQPAQIAVLAQLAPGTRTPLFRIPRDRAVYSWYLRLAAPRAIEHAWAGIVRLETLDSIGLEAAVELADVTARHLPAFASSSIRDPRAPQNLYPIGALEDRLRRQLGDHELIRRHIEAHFQRVVAA